MLTSVSELEVGMYILYENLIHIIISISKHQNYYQINMEGIYLINTLVKLTLSSFAKLDKIQPNCKTYNIDKWLEHNNFCLSSEDSTINHVIDDNYNNITYKLALNQPISVKICIYENIEGMVILQ